MIGQQDDSQLMSRPPNLGLAQQQSSVIEPPPHQRNQMNPNTQPNDNQAQEEMDRNLPSELRSRPKILRTPADGMRPNKDQDMPQHDQLKEAPQPPVKIKGELVNDENKLKEHGEGFVSREKIARTPPEEKMQRDNQRRHMQYGPDAANINDYYADPDAVEQRNKLGPMQYGGGSQGQGQAVGQVSQLPLH
jgi:hypothetical protein